MAGVPEGAAWAFAVYAGPWAEARWVTESDPYWTLADALVGIWELGGHGDAEAYAAIGDEHKDEAAWAATLETLWAAITAVAGLLVDGVTVTHAADQRPRTRTSPTSPGPVDSSTRPPGDGRTPPGGRTGDGTAGSDRCPPRSTSPRTP